MFIRSHFKALVWFGSVWFGSVRFGSVWFGLVWLLFLPNYSILVVYHLIGGGGVLSTFLCHLSIFLTIFHTQNLIPFSFVKHPFHLQYIVILPSDF